MLQLVCNKLKLGYKGKVVIDNLSFSVSSGEYLCIVGENGSGKSTLLSTLTRSIRPLSGNIALGNNFTYKDIGYLPQRTDAQKDFPASVQEVILSGFLNKIGLRPFYTSYEKKKALAYAARLKIDDLYHKCFRNLSGGQQQRTLLARALCASSQMLILDEPVTGLDPEATECMYSLIQELNKKNGMTIIMVTHDLEAARKYSNKLLHLGKSVFYGNTDSFFAQGGIYA